MASPSLITSPVRARPCPGCQEELSSGKLWMSVNVQRFPIPSLIVQGERIKRKLSGHWLGAEHFPASLLGKVNEPATAEAIHNVDLGPQGVTVPCLTPAQAGHGGRDRSQEGGSLARSCWEGRAVSVHVPCSHPCSKSKPRGILSSVHLFKEV